MNPKLTGAIVALTIAALLVFLIMWLVHRQQRQENIREGRHHRGDLNKGQERILLAENAEAFAILRRLRMPIDNLSPMEIPIIPPELGERIDRLIAEHDKNQRKVLAP